MADNSERTGKQIFNELNALNNLFEAHNIDFSEIKILDAIALNQDIRELLLKHKTQTTPVGFKKE